MASKELIYEATLELASENGLGAVTLSQIASKVGIQKASLYSHFKAKEDIVFGLYEYLREKAKGTVSNKELDYGEFVRGKTALEVLREVVSAYQAMNATCDMERFYKFITAESVYHKEAAIIMVKETEKMILASKQLFYALQAQHIMQFQDVDMAAFSFAMSIHSMMNYEYQKKVAHLEEDPKKMEEYLVHFCKVYGEQEQS